MAGTSVIPQVLMVLIAVVSAFCVSARPKDAAYFSANQENSKRSQHLFYPTSMNNHLVDHIENKPKGCFHFFVTRNMSSLLAEATKMLPTIRDRQEREWILTFIYRIKSLSEHLRSHPDSQNYDCLPTDDESKKKVSNSGVRDQQQPELYFEDDFSKRFSDGEIQQDKTEDQPLQDNQESSRSSEEQKENPQKSNKSSEEHQPEPNESHDEHHDSSDSSEEHEKLAKSPEDHHDNNKPEEGSTKKRILGELNKESALGYISPPARNTVDIMMGSTETNPAELKANVMKKENNPNGNKDEQPRKYKNIPADDSDIVISSSADCQSVIECKNLNDPPPEVRTESDDIYRLYQRNEAQDYKYNSEIYEEELLKQRIRKALLEELAPELKKFKTVGGTYQDLLLLWNSVQVDKRIEESETDFDYEENGAAAGDLDMTEKIQPDRTAAPSLDQVQNSRNPKDASYEPYDDSDVLVQQLFDVRFDNLPSKTTKSLNDQNNEYLMTSTHTSY